MGRPESLKMFGFPCICHDFLGGVGSEGSSESLKKQRFIYIFYISSVEWEAWEAIIIENVEISSIFS